MTDRAAPSLAAAVEQAAAQLALDPARAAREAQAILRRAPNDPRALLILASAQRRLGQFAQAMAILAPLAKAFPRAVRTQYELGLTQAGLGQPAAAIASLRLAVSLNRDLAEAWRALGERLFEAGDVAGAEAAFAEQARAAVEDPALKPAANALFEGRVDGAEVLLRDHLSRQPDDVTALRLLAEARLRQGRYPDAEVLLARALELAPGHDGARFSYASALFRQQKAAQALPHIEQLAARDPADPAYRNLLAGCLALVGEDARVIGLYEGLLETYAAQPQIWLNYAHALRAVGRGADAVAAYRRCIALGPDFIDAYLGLANLKVAAFTEAEVAALSTLAARDDLAVDDRLQLHYALGKALEDRRDEAGAFAHYAAGGRLRLSQVPYDAEATTAQTQRSQALFTPDFFAARAGQGCPDPAPIFIVGLPRSGSTLIEQILASHSAVEGTMELADIGLIAAGLERRDAEGRATYPAALAELDAQALSALGEGFIASTQVHRKRGRPYFIDKMPNNFAHIGLIQLILPNAKIIDARRHPLGAGFSAFKQHFAQGQGFTYDQTDLGRYYRDYVDLMTHFDQVLPGRVLRVIYEDMVEDTEGQVRRLLDHCGLPFEDACLRFYENDRAVRTVSSEQVRRPIFRDGLDQWRRFEPWLGPMKQALGPALEGWRG